MTFSFGRSPESDADKEARAREKTAKRAAQQERFEHALEDYKDKKETAREVQREATFGGPARAQQYEYATTSIRSKLIGDLVDHAAVAMTINQYAERGWRLKSVTETEVRGRVGPGGTMGLLLVFERPAPSPSETAQ